MSCSAGVRTLAIGTDRRCLAHLQDVVRYRLLDSAPCQFGCRSDTGSRYKRVGKKLYLKLGLVVLDEFVDRKEVDRVKLVIHRGACLHFYTGVTAVVPDQISHRSMPGFE